MIMMMIDDDDDDGDDDDDDDDDDGDDDDDDDYDDAHLEKSSSSTSNLSEWRQFCSPRLFNPISGQNKFSNWKRGHQIRTSSYLTKLLEECLRRSCDGLCNV